MAFPTGEQIDIIATKILFDAKEAISQLKGWNISVDEGAQRTLLFKEIIKAVAKQIDGDMKAATAAVNKFASSLGFNPVLITKVGKELQAVALIAEKMGISFSEAESRFGGFAIMITQGTQDMVLFGAEFRSAIASGLPPLALVQTALMAISTQLTVIKAQLQGFRTRPQGGVPLLGSGGAGGGGVPPDVIDAQWEEVSNSANKASGAMNNTEESAKRAGNAGQEAGKKTQNAFERALSSVNVIRIAMGALISMILFQGIQAFTQFFKTAIDNAQQLEASLYRIHNAERILSGEGIQVSVKGLEDGIKRIKNLLPIFSKEDIAGLVGQVAITTKSLGLTEQQIVDLSEAIAILNVNSAEEETLQATAQHVISSLLTSNAKGVANLGLKLGDAAIQAKALEMGLLKAGESASDLTDHEKAIVKVQIAIDGAGQSVAGLNEFMETNTAKIQKNKAAWNDLLTTIGQLLLPFVPAVTAVFDALTDATNTFKAFAAAIGIVLTTFLTTLRLFALGGIKNLDDLKVKFKEIGEAAKDMISKMFFPEGVPEGAPKWFKDFFAPHLTTKETPTGIPSVSEVDQEAESKRAEAVKKAEKDIQEVMKDSAEKKLDIERDYQRKLADIATDYSNKLQDIARDTAEKRKDALRNLNQKIEDINRSANEKIAEANQDARKKEKDREAEFQNKLRELREKFLFDLEDALHERDARQILRLIRQYNLDKKNLEERRKLDEQQSKVDLKRKIADIERDRQLKIEAAKREYADKLNEIAIGEQRALAEARLWQQRQLADARLWHQRQLQEQREYLQRKLKDIADALKAEYNMTAAGAAAITNLMSATLSAQASLLEKIAAGTMIPVMSNGALVGATYPGGGWQALADSWKNSGMYGTGMAEGGTMIATKPTTVTFGERGPEVASFSPIGRNGANIGKVFGGGSPMGGSISIALQLSPDLEARIIDSSLESVAVHLERVSRSK